MQAAPARRKSRREPAAATSRMPAAAKALVTLRFKLQNPWVFTKSTRMYYQRDDKIEEAKTRPRSEAGNDLVR